MVTAELFIEGGGDPRSSRSKELMIRFREGWGRFFRKAGLGPRMPKVVRGGGRERTFSSFRIAAMNHSPEVLPLLLVDSETPVRTGHSVWEHLKTHGHPWQKPVGTRDDQAFLMVQVMETWFLADRNRLKEFFGSRFAEGPLQPWPDLEAVPKPLVLKALEDATAHCGTKYGKGRVSFDLLARIDPALVEDACPHARALLDRLRET